MLSSHLSVGAFPRAVAVAVDREPQHVGLLATQVVHIGLQNKAIVTAGCDAIFGGQALFWHGDGYSSPHAWPRGRRIRCMDLQCEISHDASVNGQLGALPSSIGKCLEGGGKSCPGRRLQ